MAIVVARTKIVQATVRIRSEGRTESLLSCYMYLAVWAYLLKEESDFRNERDVVPAAIRAGPNRRLFFLFFWKGGTLQRDAEVESFWSF